MEFIHDLDDMILPHVRVEQHYLGLWHQFTWRRSALDFAQQLLAWGMMDPKLVARGIDTSQHAPVLQTLAQEAAQFDAVLLKRLEAGQVWTAAPPLGLPKEHWWWWRGTCDPSIDFKFGGR